MATRTTALRLSVAILAASLSACAATPIPYHGPTREAATASPSVSATPLPSQSASSVADLVSPDATCRTWLDAYQSTQTTYLYGVLNDSTFPWNVVVSYGALVTGTCLAASDPATIRLADAIAETARPSPQPTPTPQPIPTPIPQPTFEPTPAAVGYLPGLSPATVVNAFRLNGLKCNPDPFGWLCVGRTLSGSYTEGTVTTTPLNQVEAMTAGVSDAGGVDRLETLRFLNLIAGQSYSGGNPTAAKAWVVASWPAASSDPPVEMDIGPAHFVYMVIGGVDASLEMSATGS
jgi:hypothetical protein